MIHCFLYFLDGSSKRTLDDDEMELIQFISTNQNNIFSNSKIFFIINFTNKTEDNDINSYKNFLLNALEQKFGPLSELAKKENIIEINLKRDIEYNRILRFGMDEIFLKMHNYFKSHKIDVNDIKNIDNNRNNNNENRRLTESEILNRQIEKLNESMCFKFFKRVEDYKNKYINICEETIHSSKKEAQKIGLFILESDTTKYEEIRKNMFEFIHDHFASIFDCDIPFYESDYKINEEEKFICPIINWFKKKERYPLIIETKGKEYLEKNKNHALENHNINFCISLAELYNNSIDLLLLISKNMKGKINNEKGIIEDINNMNKAEEESINEYYKSTINYNINNQNDAFSTINLLNESSSSNYNSIDKKIKIPKNYKRNNEFIIELDIKKDHPKFNVIVHVVGNFYVFKIKVNEEEITLEKSISEIQLETEKCKNIEKGKENNKYYLIFNLKNEENSQEFDF